MQKNKFNEMTEEQAIYYRMAVRDCYYLLFNKDHKLLVPNSVEARINNLETAAIKRLMRLGKIPKLKKCDDPKCMFPIKEMESACCK